MEKRTPHHKLSDIQAQVSVRGVECFTRTAINGCDNMGLDAAQALAVIAGMTRAMFQKSMTTNMDHTVWQDVYNAPTPRGDAYVKFTLRSDGSVVISFKAL